MSVFTTILNLIKPDSVADANQTFNLKTFLNDNWDKLDTFAAKTITTDKLVNNLAATEAGFGLDATQGKAIQDEINAINAQLSGLVNQYEEGTFTPYITGATNSGTFVPVYSAQNGSFIRQNKLIIFKLKVVLLSYTGAFNGNLRIAGLPFAAASDGVNVPLSVSDLNNLDMDTNAKFVTAQVMNSSSAIALLQPTDNSSGISVTNTNLGQTFAITITGQYQKT